MNVPLAVRPEFQGGTMRLQRLEEFRWKSMEVPFHPYTYARRPLTTNLHVEGGVPEGEKVERRLLSTLNPTDLWRYEFDTTLPVAQLNAQEGVLGLLESHVRFTDRVAIDRPDYYREFPYDAPLRPLVLDLEALTKHGRNLGKWWAGALDAEGEVHQWRLDSKVALEELITLISRHDVIAGYNIEGYDWPNLTRLASAYNLTLPSNHLQYDVAQSAFSDQTLSGIKTRGLKNVAKWYGFPMIEVDGRNTCNYPEADLMTYNASDLHGTGGLFNIYFPRLLAVAELTGLPLGLIVEGEKYTSSISGVVCARGLFRKGIVSDGTNLQRHPEITGKVRGAFVSLTPAGLGRHGRTGKVDVRQMYPSIMLQLNLGPDTTFIRRYEPLIERLEVRRSNGVATYFVPDENLGKTVVISVNENEVSILREYLTQMGTLRETIKARLKGLTEAEKAQSPLHAQENAIKVLRNALYGYQLAKDGRFSDLGVGIIVTCVGRTFIRDLGAHLDEIEKGTTFEVDTDGIYFNAEEATA
jgi:DNA polymerase elongation subunit (family B)